MSQTLMLVFHDMRLGGIQKKIIDIIDYHHKHHPDTRLILCLREKTGIFLKQVPPGISIIHPTFYTRKFNTIWFTFWLFKTLRSLRPSHIVSFMDLGSVPLLVSLKFLPWYRPQVTIGEDILTSKYVYTESFPFLRLLLIRLLYPRANRILVQTPVQKKDLENILHFPSPVSKIVATENWLPLNFPPKNIPPLSSRPIDILFVGRIESQKNLKLFVEIIRTLSYSHPKIKSVIVGDGTEKPEILSLIKKYRLSGNIRILPPNLNTIRYYSQAKVFLLTSEYEGFPLTLMEAISSGCYPVTRSIPEVSRFFTRSLSTYVFSTPEEAVRLITRALTINQPPASLKFYQDKILRSQSSDISAYVEYFYRP